MPPAKKKTGRGAARKEPPPSSGAIKWLEAWHLDHGHTGQEKEELMSALRKVEWPTSIGSLTADDLLGKLHACGYEYAWAPRLAGDIKRATELKDSEGTLGPMVKPRFRDLPDVVIFPNGYFIDMTPDIMATAGEFGAWIKAWFIHGAGNRDFTKFVTKFDYQCPLTLIDELDWDADDILFFNKTHLKKSILGINLKPGFLSALACDVREARKLLRERLAYDVIRQRKIAFDIRQGTKST